MQLIKVTRHHSQTKCPLASSLIVSGVVDVKRFADDPAGWCCCRDVISRKEVKGKG